MVADGHELTGRLAALAAAASILASGVGCAKPTSIYRWGVYENLIYQMYANPGEADPSTQIAQLTEDIARTHAGAQRVHPGDHAHLGFLYYTQGQVDLAHEAFSTEKELFPESTTFIDGILARMQAQ